MTYHSYVVVGLFATELSVEGIPLLLLIRSADSIEEPTLSRLFLADIETELSSLPPEARKWSEELFDSLRSAWCGDQKRTANIFELFSRLSVGPLRTMIEGTIASHEHLYWGGSRADNY